MTVDGHCHAVPQDSWIGEGWWDGYARLGAAALPGVTPELLREAIAPALLDPDASTQLGAMEAAGTDVAVMFPFDWTRSSEFGPAGTGWREQNAWFRDLAAAHPGRIRWGFGADPRHDGALEAFREAVGAGAVCLKLHPGGGFALNDPVVNPFLQAAGEAGVPAVIHVGPVPSPGHSRWAAPELLDQVAADFIDLPIQAAHTGNALWRETLAVATVNANVFCDLSGWQLRFLRNPDRFYADVREVLDSIGAERVMFGTDAPWYRPVVPDDDYLGAFTAAPEGTFSPEEVAAIRGGTAAAFFGLG